MSERLAAARTTVVINGDEYELSLTEDIIPLQRRFEAAAATPGRFVEFSTASGDQVNALVTGVTRVTILTRRPRAETNVTLLTPQFGVAEETSVLDLDF